jgi:hypothetical protein
MDKESPEEVPDPHSSTPESSKGSEDQYTHQLLVETTRRLIRDMKFVSIFTIIIGVFYCLTFIGAIFGIPMIIAGIRLRDGARAFSVYQENQDEFTLEKALRYQQKFFFIGKILIIISIVLFLLYIVGIIFFFSYMMDSMQMMQNFDGHIV